MILDRHPGENGTYSISIPIDPAELVGGTNEVSYAWTGTTGLPPRTANTQIVWQTGDVPTSTAPPTSTSTTTAAPVTTSTTASPTSTVASGTKPNSPGCGLAAATFCDTFDAPVNGGTQTGDLDPNLWGVSRRGDMVLSNGWAPSHNACSGNTTLVAAPADARVCNGLYVESVNDATGTTALDSYPKQPFDFTGRTGVVVFDVSADSQGTHAAWPEFVITDEPVPGVARCISECGSGDQSGTATAGNQIGFSLAGGDGPSGPRTGVDNIFMSRAAADGHGVYSALTVQQYGTITKGCLDGNFSTPCTSGGTKLNHFEVRVSTTRIDIYGTDSGDTTLKHLAGADIPGGGLAFSKGLVWINDVHYNARKAFEPCECGTQFDHSFAWDNVGFDGPKTYRDLGTDVRLAHADTGRISPAGDPLDGLGYKVGGAGASWTLRDVTWSQQPTAAKVVLNAYQFTDLPLTVTLNGQSISQSPPQTYHTSSMSYVFPASVARKGDNTLSIRSSDGSAVVANVSLIIVAGAPVP